MKPNQDDKATDTKVLAELAHVKTLVFGVYVALFFMFILHWCVFWARLD
jgi:L-cystine uptake protein TcyP (sodium:dicarboxylate symporter family)